MANDGAQGLAEHRKVSRLLRHRRLEGDGAGGVVEEVRGAREPRKPKPSGGADAIELEPEVGESLLRDPRHTPTSEAAVPDPPIALGPEDPAHELTVANAIVSMIETTSWKPSPRGGSHGRRANEPR